MANNPLSDFKKEFYNLAIQSYDFYMQNKTKQAQESYRRISSIYERISLCKTSVEIEKIRKEINTSLTKLDSEYKKMYATYQTNKDKELYKKLKAMLEQSKEYKSMMSLIDKYLPEISKIKPASKGLPSLETKPKEKKQTVSPVKEEKPVKKPAVKKQVDPSDLATYLNAISANILKEREALEKLDKNSEEYHKKETQIYNMCLDRENRIKDVLGYDGVNLLMEIESLEQRILTAEETINSSFYGKQLSTEELSTILRKNIETMSSRLFEEKPSKKQIIDFNNILMNVFGTTNVTLKINKGYNGLNEDIDVFDTESFISYFELYNLNGDYQEFKAKHEKNKIGNETIKKKEYNQMVDRLQMFVDALISRVESKVEKNPNGIVIKNTQKTKKDLKQEHAKKVKELENMINMSMSQGGSHVH